MTDIRGSEADLARRRALCEHAILQLGKCGGNIKLAAQACKREDQDSIAMHTADAMVNLIEMADLYSIPLMSNVFKRLEQIDRLDGGSPEVPKGST